MDWLRRNWPDLLIGVALVAVVALIVVTLLSGGSLASLVRRDNPPELPITDTTANTNAAQTAAGNAAPGTTPAADADANGTDPSSEDGGVDVFVPGVPGGQADTASSASGGQAQASAPPNAAGTQTASGGVAQSSAQDSTASSGPPPETAQDGGFRVAAGAVDSRDAAASLAETYRDADYTVTAEQQGDLYLLWIGPYATRADADRIAAQLQTDGVVPDALVYSYSGPDDGSSNSSENGDSPDNSSSGSNAVASTNSETASTNSSTAAGTETANTAAAEPAGAAPMSSSGVNAAAGTGAGASTSTNTAGANEQRYLQVGAFTSDEDAQPLRDRLETLGFSVTRRISDTGLVRLVVGPLGDAQLTQAQTRLTREGITDAFPVAP